MLQTLQRLVIICINARIIIYDDDKVLDKVLKKPLVAGIFRDQVNTGTAADDKCLQIFESHFTWRKNYHDN